MAGAGRTAAKAAAKAAAAKEAEAKAAAGKAAVAEARAREAAREAVRRCHLVGMARPLATSLELDAACASMTEAVPLRTSVG